MRPDDYQLARIALLAPFGARAVELGQQIYGEASEQIAALRATIVDRDAQVAALRTTSQGHYDDALAARDEVAALRAVIEGTIPRYAEMFEACGLGNPTESVAIQDMVAALAAPPIDSARQEAERRVIRAAVSYRHAYTKAFEGAPERSSMLSVRETRRELRDAVDALSVPAAATGAVTDKEG